MLPRMTTILTQTELEAVVSAADVKTYVYRTVFGCGCGTNHGAACPN